jgi:hypothetical protein
VAFVFVPAAPTPNVAVIYAVCGLIYRARLKREDERINFLKLAVRLKKGYSYTLEV